MPFMNVREHPVGGQKAIHGSICHVPVDVAPTVNSLPCDLEENDTISVKIKHNRSYKHHILAENIRPNKVLKGLHYLLEHSEIFQKENIQINSAWLRKMTTKYRNEVSHKSSDWSQTVDIQEGQDGLDIGEANISSTAMPTADSTSMLSVETVVPFTDDIEKEEEEEDPCNAPSTNTMLDENHIDPGNTTLSFAPGEGKRPVFHELLTEYLCFPTIFCGQEHPRNAERIMPTVPGRYI